MYASGIFCFLCFFRPLRRLLIVALCLAILPAYAQVTAPVHASLQLSKPYPLSLADYVQPGANRVSATIFLLDNTGGSSVDHVQVKLRLVIENNTVRISTSPSYVSPNVITLASGVPEMLSESDLVEYFDPKNLDFVGLDKGQYLKTGRLPEGFYTFRLEVYEYYRGTRLTNQSPSALAWLILNDPPRWVIPSPYQKLTATDPQQLMFQWLPMHTGSPNAVSGVQYDLTMVELRPNYGQNPNDALNTLSPFHTVEGINPTSVFIGPDAPQLVPGRTYAMRLQVRDPSGLGLFKNNGYSEAIAFTFGDACAGVESPMAQVRSAREANIGWMPKPNHTAFTLSYREKGQITWYTDNAAINEHTVTNLNPSRTYEYTVTAKCGTLVGNPTEMATFATPAATPADAGCNSTAIPTSSTKLTAREALYPGEEYVSQGTGRVKLVMDNIQKEPDGKFSGVGRCTFGFVPVPLAVEVKGLVVSLDGRMLDGDIRTITFGVYVIDASSLIKAEAILNNAASLLNGNPPSDADLNKLESTLQEIRNLPPAAQALVQQGISEIKAGNTESGKATVQQGLAMAKTELEKTANKGGITFGGGNSGSGKELQPLSGLDIRFNNAPDSKYGFDVKEYDQISSTYLQENGSYIPWKSIESGYPDPIWVTVSITGKKIKRDSIMFATQNGGSLALTNGKISPLGGSDGTVTEVYALYPTTGGGMRNVAQVNVIGYSKEINTVVIVPLGRELPINAQVLADSLNRTFGQAVAGFNVEVEPVFNPKGWDGTVSIGGTGMLSAYTQSQRDIINAYKKQSLGFSASKYYVFIGGTPSDPGIQGYMPRARKFGFIFDRTNTAKTLAHELGHGVFHLRHAFDEKGLPRDGDNLMSYGKGTRLHKYQWDKVHNPEFVLGLLEDDEDAMAKSTSLKGTPVAKISDSTMTEGKIFIYNGSLKQMKVKFSTSDSSKSKLTYKLSIVLDGSKTTINYPKANYDTLIFNQEKTITLESIPEGKYTLICKSGQTEYKTNFYIRKQKFEVTKEQLKKIFKGTDVNRIEEVVSAINENSLLFSINTAERMAHFLGQIGAETGGLKKLKESSNYTATNIFNTFLKPNLRSNSSSSTGKTFYYCDLVEGYNCTSLDNCQGTNQGQSDCDKAIPVKLNDNNKCAWSYVAFDSTYNVKTEYINSPNLFDYVYGCRMDNEAKSTKDGSTYLGKGFIHITGKSGYKSVSNEWNKIYPDDKKEFHGEDINLLETDINVAIKVSLVYWKLKNLNNLADNGIEESDINAIGAKVNGANPPNGADLRKQYSEAAIKNLK